ncbi:MAG: hypothetical protein M3004_11165 [Bacteroidota bacterium]|nr:hypothetical protein [Bacteroidota bacterium]
MKSASYHKFLIWIFIFVIHPTIKGQTYLQNVEIFNESSGLSNNSITAILQDKRGYLWIGTKTIGLQGNDCINIPL